MRNLFQFSTIFLAPALLALPACSRHRPRQRLDAKTFHYAYIDIGVSFFTKEAAPSGEALYVSRRPHSNPSSFPTVKPPRTKRIFLIGGSVAIRLRDTRIAFANALSADVEVINGGMPIYDSDRDASVVSEIAAYEPDLVVVLSGNNEFFNPVRLPAIIAYIRYYLLRSGLMGFLPFARLPARIPEPARLRAFERNLRRMVERINAVDAPIVLCTLPNNLRDAPPTQPVGPSPWGDADFAEGTAAIESGDAPRALRALGAYQARHPDDALSSYFIGRAWEMAKHYAAAVRWYGRSLDLRDNYCGPAKNAVIRRVCAQTHGCVLADLEAEFARRAPHGLTGSDMFIDGVHWRHGLDPAVNETIVAAVRRHDLAGRIPRFARPQDWRRTAAAVVPPSKKEDAEAAWYGIDSLIRSADNGSTRNDYTIASFQACRLSPEALIELVASLDNIRRVLDSKWLNASDDNLEAVWPLIASHAGEALRRSGDLADALTLFDLALKLDPSLSWAHLWRGLTLAGLRRRPEAREDFVRACAPLEESALFARALGVCAAP